MSLIIDVDAKEALAFIKSLDSAMNDREALNSAIATSAEREVREHLIANYVPRNKRGNFWERVENSVEVKSDESEAVVSLTELGINLRYKGGDVFPGKNPAASGPNKGKLTTALAVPSDAVPVRRGRQIPPSRAGLLAFIRNATGGETVGYLTEGEERAITKGPRKGQTRIAPKVGGALMYTLRSVTHHKEDKGILPSEEKLLEAAEEGALDYIDSFKE